jgi:hypothetical protein
MKKFFITLGVIFATLIVLAVVFIGYIAYTGSKLDKSARDYADQNIPLIISTWSPDTFIKISSPELRKVATPRDIESLLKKLSELGHLKSYEKSEGNSQVFFNTESGKVVTADLTAHAIFDNGKANLNIRLIQHDGQWELLKFYVESPLFLK